MVYLSMLLWDNPVLGTAHLYKENNTMNKRTRFTCLFLALSLAAFPRISVTGRSLAVSDSITITAESTAGTFVTTDKEAFRPMAGGSSEDQFHTFAVGPGLVNLSPADEYATYQWGLKNDGEFQQIELKTKFEFINDLYGRASRTNGGIGLPQPGPGDFESIVTESVAGIDINVRPAWDLYDQSGNRRSLTVAIIDTGVDFTHQDLIDAIWTNPGEVAGDGIDNDGNGYIDDVYGWNFYHNTPFPFAGEEDSHGTHAAGTIGAKRGMYGITGITDNSYVKLMILKALGGQEGIGSPASVIEAIRYAEANGASICNLSMGTMAYNEELARTIQESNMLFVVACGNGDLTGMGYDIDRYPIYPASFPYDNVISVANLLFDGNLSRDSNYGAVSVDIAAPGSYILSTLPGNNYGFMSGTSMAAPMVTGVAAMLYSYRPELSLSDVKNILLASSRKMSSLSGKMVSGGMLDAYAALTYPDTVQ